MFNCQYILNTKFSSKFNSTTITRVVIIITLIKFNRASEISPAAPVLARPVFSQGKNKLPFLQKESNKQSANVIFGLIRLIILSKNR